MHFTKQYENKKVLVLGLAKSGLNVANLLHRLGALVTVNDYKPIEENPEARELVANGIKVITGGHPEDLLEEDFEFIVKNPGIPYNNPVVKQALEKEISIVSEVEIALSVNESELVAITGTNGKTTTTTMVHELLSIDRDSGDNYIGGNIGVPISGVVQNTDNLDDIALELSSFQLMATPSLKPSIAVITNIYSAHLDYHSSRDEYVDAKLNITAKQDSSDYLIYNADQEEVSRLVKERSQATLVPFSRREVIENGAYLKDGVLYFKGEAIIEADELGLPGNHNIENALAAIAVAKLKGVDSEMIKKILEHFTGVKHRSEFVGEWKERTFINDSKATNILATEMAIGGFSQPVVLLAGGLERNEDFSTLIPTIKESVKAVVAFGETADKILEAGEKAGVEKLAKVADVKEAVPQAYEYSDAGDVILLSPACASWDQYVSFEVRGEEFIGSVKQLIEGED